MNAQAMPHAPPKTPSPRARCHQPRPRSFEEVLHDERPTPEQAERVRSVYHRQLAVPLLGAEQTLEAYKRWEQAAAGEGAAEAKVGICGCGAWGTVEQRDWLVTAVFAAGRGCNTLVGCRLCQGRFGCGGAPQPAAHLLPVEPPGPPPLFPAYFICPAPQVPAHVIAAYEKAQGLVQARRQYENSLAGSEGGGGGEAAAADTGLLAAYMAYAKAEEAHGDPARVQVGCWGTGADGELQGLRGGEIVLQSGLGQQVRGPWGRVVQCCG